MEIMEGYEHIANEKTVIIYGYLIAHKATEAIQPHIHQALDRYITQGVTRFIFVIKRNFHKFDILALCIREIKKISPEIKCGFCLESYMVSELERELDKTGYIDAVDCVYVEKQIGSHSLTKKIIAQSEALICFVSKPYMNNMVLKNTREAGTPIENPYLDSFSLRISHDPCLEEEAQFQQLKKSFWAEFERQCPNIVNKSSLNYALASILAYTSNYYKEYWRNKFSE